MAAIRTVEDLTTDEDLIGYYDYEEAKEQETNARFEQGMKQGIEQGAKQNAMETAKKMFTLPTITLEQIASCTGLSLEEIEKLK